MSDDVISPELVLVSPELRERALAALPPLEVDGSLPRRPRSGGRRPLRAAIWDLVGVAVVAGATAVTIVVVLTAVADALR